MFPAAILNLTVWALQGSPAFGATGHSWTESAASILISSLWQGALVASGLGLFLRLVPRIPARLRYGVWAAGFAALVCLPVLPVLFKRLTQSAFFTPSANPLGMSAESWQQSLPSHSLFSLDVRWSLGLAALWLAASLLRATGLVAHAVRMRQLWNSAIPVGAAHSGVLERSLEQSIDAPDRAFRTPAELCATSDLGRPCVIGFFRPRILIPAWLLTRLTPSELDQIVLHESEHLRRNDDWVNLLQKLCLVVFPLNPALWWLERRLCAEREMACDDGVISRTQAPRAYAACLAGLAERGLEHRNALREALHPQTTLSQDALSLGAWQRRPELATRVHRLLRRTPVLSPATAAAAVSLVGCGLIAATVALAHSPQLVAFVAPAQRASSLPTASAHNLQASLLGDVNTDFRQRSIAFAGSSPLPYRAVKTMAVLPAPQAVPVLRSGNPTPRTNSKGHADQAQQTGDSSLSGHSLASLVPNAVAARMNAQQTTKPGAPQATQTSATQTSYLVLTTYEEVQTTGSNEGVQGDGVAGDTTTNSAAQGAHTSTSVTITRLVFRLDQPASNKPPTSNAKPASNASPASNSTQPIAIPYRDGWFVIQL